MRLKKAMAQLIHAERACRVATVDEAGTPHLVPVCQGVADGKIYFASGRGARKGKKPRANPRVAAAGGLYSGARAHLRGGVGQGTAVFVDKGPRLRKARA